MEWRGELCFSPLSQIISRGFVHSSYFILSAAIAYSIAIKMKHWD